MEVLSWETVDRQEILKTVLWTFQLCLFHKLFLLCNKDKLWKMAGMAHSEVDDAWLSDKQ